MNFTKLFLLTFIGIALIILVFFSSIVALITDWWWYSEVGVTEIFIKSLTAKIGLGLLFGLIALGFLVSNFFIAVQSRISWVIALPSSLVGSPISIDKKVMIKLGVVVSLFIAFLFGLIAASNWKEFLEFFSAQSFGQRDPLFGKDISFYVFSLPIYSLVVNLLKSLIVMSLIICSTIYILRGKLNILSFFGKMDLSKLIGKPYTIQESDSKARLHIGVLLALLFVTIAVLTYFSLYNLLTTQSGSVFGASFTDANVIIPILYVSVFVYSLAALLSLYFGISGRSAPLFGAISLTLVVGFASWIIPSLFQKLVVAPNELVKETPFIKYNIESSRRAYGIDKVEEREIAADKSLTPSDIAANNLTIKNIRLWDREPLLSTFSQIQEIRTYYEFSSVDNDRYTINNELRQIMLSPREMAANSLPNKNWINEQLTFTHGYGVAAGPVNLVTPEGLPVLFVKDLPPKSEVKELSIKRPEVYYGEIPNEYVIVKTKSKEFDYPKGDENVYSTYNGNGGVEMNSPFKRLLYAVRFGSLKLLLSSDIKNESRIMYHRNIVERVNKIAPFLSFDHDPYLVIAEGRLFWILDAYTSTNRYPYSQQLSVGDRNINYIRNSVKVVIDAYDGSTKFYQSDTNDPIIKTYSKIFPTTFHPLSEMPKSLVVHLRYPEEIFTLQTEIYSTYHMDDPQIFYNKEDQWEIPEIPQEGGDQQIDGAAPAMAPRHMIMKLPGEKLEEFILMLPFTPRAKDNLSAWMVAKNDGDQYGKLIVYRFPKDKLVFGPKQIIGRINQDAEVSRQISLWDQRGSQVIQGILSVIPIEESLIYIRPLYLKADTGKIPELKRVIVAYENKIVMEETLELGLARIFGTSAPDQVKQATNISVPTPPANTTEIKDEDLLQQANQAYETAINAQKEGDWTRYGEEIKRLGEILNRLRQQQ